MSFGNPLGNPLGNPFGLPIGKGGGVKVQVGSSSGKTATPSVLTFPLTRVDVNKSVLLVSLANATSSGYHYGLTSFSPEEMVFTSGNSPSSGEWPVISWVLLELPNVKRITRIDATIPAGANAVATVPLPEGCNPSKTFVVPILTSTNVQTSQVSNAYVTMGATSFTLGRGAGSTSRAAASYQCQVVELE